MKIEILGTGCPKCENLTRNAKAAVETLGVSAEVVKVTDIGEIAARGVMMTPALVVDGQVKSSGKLLTVEEIGQLLR
jgi:small redox-active disulfide protein 2